jgi:hypothetical protein
MGMVQITPPPLSSQSLADLLCTIMILCYGTEEDGQPFWAYMCIKPSMAKSFKDARDRGAFSLEDYGTILEKGLGMEVPYETKQRMERDYGVNHNYEDELLIAIESMKHQATA